MELPLLFVLRIFLTLSCRVLVELLFAYVRSHTFYAELSLDKN